MIISFNYNGESYVNFDTNSSLFQSLDIPSDVKEKAILDAKWSDIREQREPLILATDWTQMPDAPLETEKKAEFTTYRQALRDIPQCYDKPDDVVWPLKPTI